MTPTYKRDISKDEAEQGYFLVLKNKLSFFPATGSTFYVKSGAKQIKAVVESYHCECRGPEEPHEHYFIRWKGLAKGDHVIMKRMNAPKPTYSVRIEE
jgi:hypothetical protein